jgi:hypothetical protein
MLFVVVKGVKRPQDNKETVSELSRGALHVPTAEQERGAASPPAVLLSPAVVLSAWPVPLPRLSCRAPPRPRPPAPGQVRNVRPGDRVVSCFDIACGNCTSCKRGAFSGCDVTNPSRDQEMLYGARYGASSHVYRTAPGDAPVSHDARSQPLPAAPSALLMRHCVVAFLSTSYSFPLALASFPPLFPALPNASLAVCRTAGLFGYAHVTGGYEGGQADYVRVPFGGWSRVGRGTNTTARNAVRWSLPPGH